MSTIHDPEIGKNKRPHVPIETITIGEAFRRIENGETINQPDADYTSMKESLKRRAAKKTKQPEPKTP